MSDAPEITNKGNPLLQALVIPAIACTIPGPLTVKQIPGFPVIYPIAYAE